MRTVVTSFYDANPSRKYGEIYLDCEGIRLSLCECADVLQVTQKILALKPDKRSLDNILLWDWWTTRNKTNAGESAQSTEEVCF
jgi:hypothetical protein